MTEADTPDHGATRDLLMVSLSRFYSQKNHMHRVIPYITCQSGVSLRLIDWFVTNYSKKKNTILTRQASNNIVHFNVYLSYRAQLKAYSKQQFDPFRRRDRVMFYYDRNRSVETTVGQLNFFRWTLQNDVLDYIVANSGIIETDMIASQKLNSGMDPTGNVNKNKPVGVGGSTRKKRSELSQCKATRNMTRLVGDRTMLFD
jgi:hypothetical protein